MGQGPYELNAGFDDDLFADHRADPDDVALAGLPESWRNYRWWLAALAFSGLWMLQSWTILEALSGVSHLLQLSLSIVSLLLSLGSCWALYQLCKPHSPALSQVVCVLGATLLLFQHAG